MSVSTEELIAACGDEGQDAGIGIVAQLDPLAGFGEPVKPAVYEGGTYQHDRRWIRDSDGSARQVDVIVIDNVPSQANRLEAALLAARAEAGLPELVLELGDLGLPVHLPERLSSFQWPHRSADAYLRDSELNGRAFSRSPQGKAILESTSSSPQALFEWMPQALLFGFWQSQLGKKRQNTKRARAWVSEIIGIEPAAMDTKIKGLKGDPLNLSVDDAAIFDPDDKLTWEMTDETKKGKSKDGKSKERLSELGLGQVPIDGAPGGVSFRTIEQHSTVSFAQLRTIHVPDNPEASAAGRALLAAIGLLAHVDAFGSAFQLRSGCDLRPASVDWRWLGADGDTSLTALDHDSAIALVRDCAEIASGAGLPVGAAWPTDPLRLKPNKHLTNAIKKTWPDLADH